MKQDKNKKGVWVAMHILGAKSGESVHRIGTYKEIVQVCKRDSYNPKAPLYYPIRADLVKVKVQVKTISKPLIKKLAVIRAKALELINMAKELDGTRSI